MSNMADLNFDASTVEPNKGFGLIPAGDYDAVIIASEKKETNAGTGHYLSLTFQILSGEFQNRRLWANLNLWNPSDKAQQIARGDLSAICRAVNVLTVKDSTELHNRPLKISIVVRKNKQNDENENRIAAYKPRHAAPQPVAPAVAEAQPTAMAAAPW